MFMAYKIRTSMLPRIAGLLRSSYFINRDNCVYINCNDTDINVMQSMVPRIAGLFRSSYFINRDNCVYVNCNDTDINVMHALNDLICKHNADLEIARPAFFQFRKKIVLKL